MFDLLFDRFKMGISEYIGNCIKCNNKYTYIISLYDNFDELWVPICKECKYKMSEERTSKLEEIIKEYYILQRSIEKDSYAKHKFGEEDNDYIYYMPAEINLKLKDNYKLYYEKIIEIINQKD